MSIWKLSMDLAVEIYELTESIPKKEDYSLTSQIRRSALSISANIAEGFGRYHNKDKIKVTETQSHLIYCSRVKFLKSDVSENLIERLEEINKSLKNNESTLKRQ